MALNLEYLRLFHAVARHKSISRAAEELHLSQPTVTKELKKLEEQAGFPLFLRHSRGVSLTQEGEYLLRRLDGVMQELLKTEAETENLRGLRSGIVRVSYSSAVTESVLSGVMEAFREKYPGIQILSCVAPRGLMCPLLNQGLVDLAFGHRPTTFRATDRLDSARTPLWQPETLNGYSMGVFKNVVVAGPQLAHLAQTPLSLEDLAPYPILFQRYMDDFGRNYYLNHIPQTPAVKENNLVVEDLKVLFHLLRTGPWISIASSIAMELYPEEPLISLPVSGLTHASEYLLYYSKQSPPCLAALALMDFVNNHPVFSVKEIDPVVWAKGIPYNPAVAENP